MPWRPQANHAKVLLAFWLYGTHRAICVRLPCRTLDCDDTMLMVIWNASCRDAREKPWIIRGLTGTATACLRDVVNINQLAGHMIMRHEETLVITFRSWGMRLCRKPTASRSHVAIGPKLNISCRGLQIVYAPQMNWILRNLNYLNDVTFCVFITFTNFRGFRRWCMLMNEIFH